MKSLLCGAAFLAGIAGASAAEPRYDHALEKAAAGIVAARIGDLRGGFSFGQKLRLVPDAAPAPGNAEPPRHEEPADVAIDGLVPAVERPAARVTF